MAKKGGKEITLAEHISRIAPLGGKARAASMTTEERVAAGKAGGKARAENLTKRKRSEIAKKAAAARWGKKIAPVVALLLFAGALQGQAKSVNVTATSWNRTMEDTLKSYFDREIRSIGDLSTDSESPTYKLYVRGLPTNAPGEMIISAILTESVSMFLPNLCAGGRSDRQRASGLGGVFAWDELEIIDQNDLAIRASVAKMVVTFDAHVFHRMPQAKTK